MTDPTQPAAFSLAALVPCGPASTRISETLLSLAAQTSPALEIHVIVEGGSSSELRGLQDLVGTFDEDFSRRVHVAAMDRFDSRTAVAVGVARSRATHVAGPRRSESMPLAPAVGPWHPWSRCRPLTHGRGVTYER